MKKFYLGLIVLLLSNFSYAQTGIVTTLAGDTTNGCGDAGGMAFNTPMNMPYAVAVSPAGEVYVAEGLCNKIFKISQSGLYLLVAGTGVGGFSGDGGLATDAQLKDCRGVAFDHAGNLYIGDAVNARIRKVDAVTGIITTVAGGGFSLGNGVPATNASFGSTPSVTFDAAGNMYLVDAAIAYIYKVNTAGIISIIGGTGVNGYNGDGIPATTATINNPCDIKVDAAGNVYFSDVINQRVRKINTAGIISTIGGNGSSTWVGDGIPATNSSITFPQGICLDGIGNIYIADSHDRIRKIDAAGIISTVGGGGTAFGEGGPVLNAWAGPYGLTFDSYGQMIYSDYFQGMVRKITYRPDHSSDSIRVFINNQCDGPRFSINTSRYVANQWIKTYYGDGKWDTSTCFGATTIGYANFEHTYQSSGTYRVKHLLINSGVVIDSITYSYEYIMCRTLPIKLFYDANNNSVKDTTEPYIWGPVKIEVSNNGVVVDTISATSGVNYNAGGALGDIITFRVLSTHDDLHVTYPSTGIIKDTLLSSSANEISKSFGFNCGTATNFDLSEHVSFMAGRHLSNANIIIANTSCTPRNPVFTITMSPKYVFNDANIAPTSVSGNTATWNLSNISSELEKPLFISAYFTIPTTTFLLPGDTIHSHYHLSSFTGENDYSNNEVEIIQEVIESWDPNVMEVSPRGVVHAGTRLTYTVDFENMGNDTARDISVMDTLSDNLDVKTMEMISASSEMIVSTIYDSTYHNIVKFDFPHINLLDSSHHGKCNGTFIFSIKAKSGLPDGTLIDNHAGIFFEDNPVVMTNGVENVIGQPVVVSNVGNANEVSLYPNPATNVLVIKMEKGAYSSFNISNEISQVMISQAINQAQTSVDVHSLPAGLYYISLKGENGTKVQKFVKM